MLLVLLEKWSRRHARYHHTSSRYRTLPRYPLRGPMAVVGFCLCFIPLVLGFLLPGGQLAIWAIRSAPRMLDAQFFALVGNSLTLAASAAILALALALFFVYAKRLHPSRLLRGVIRLAGMGYAMPVP